MDNQLKRIVFYGGGEPRCIQQSFDYNPDYKYSLLSQKIQDCLKERNLSKQAFANLMGVTPSLVSKWLTGKHNFTIETLFAIEEKLNLKLINIDTPNFEVITLHTSSGADLHQAHIDLLHSTIQSYETEFQKGIVMYPGHNDNSHIEYMKSINLADK